MKNQEKKKYSLSKLKEMWKDKKGRAIIELALYGIFFIGVIIFTRIMSFQNNRYENKMNENMVGFINEIKDNYESDVNITISNNLYSYHIKRLGNNTSITKKDDNGEKHYFVSDDKYYVLDNGNYILTSSEEVYPYINYNYLNINNIKKFISSGVKDNNIYKVKLSDIILNTNTDEYITITINETEKAILIDYTNLFKLDDSSIEKVEVYIKYYNINSLTSLEE